ncbi:hypothetical protein GQ53DRAFT_381232 [Thozetella sp. PMI_491]|nr:hypothetical protein GQ53DRAFT_381232 [Thozetella sp. PMI_491]
MSTPATPTNGTMTPTEGAGGAGQKPGIAPLVCIVDFHHARGPEVEKWFGVSEGTDPAVDFDWPLLPFMALSDGAHATTEDFSYFTLLRPATNDIPATSLFGISCTRQMDASKLLNRPPEVTRSTVQKAVVVIADTPQHFGMLRERLSVVTKAWFDQREFTDVEILRRFQESLAEEKKEEDRDEYLGMNLRVLIHEYKWQTLVLLKCCLLQPKMLFFGSRCERLCMVQFALVSLIPGLLRNLQDCAGPDLNSYEKSLTRPTSLKTSDRNSLLLYMGLPLQIFGRGSLFGPYTPLQQLDILADFGTKSYIVGSTNSLLLQQKDKYSDILINLDEETINITSSSLRAALTLTVADRRWIDFITQGVNDTWDEANPERPKTMGYVGSESFIRLQFEEYLLSLISSAKYHNHLAKYGNNPKMMLPHIEGDPALDYGLDFIDYWARTENYRMWDANTDASLFDIIEPKHPCAGGLTMDDIQRRISQQVQDLHLDERFAQGREVMGRNLAAGREKASAMFNKFYADMEALREAQREAARKRAEEAKEKGLPSPDPRNGGNFPAVDLGAAQKTMQSVGTKAGAYIGSWAAWGRERSKAGWGRPPSTTSSATSNGGGWGSGWGKSKSRTSLASQSDAGSDHALKSPRMSMSSPLTGRGEEKPEERPLTQGSFSESIFDAAESESGASSNPGSSPPRKTGVQPGGYAPLGSGIDSVVASDATHEDGTLNGTKTPTADGEAKLPESKVPEAT